MPLSAAGLIAIVPVKRLDRALARLGGLLDGRERRSLQAAMLDDLLAALARAPSVGETLVVSADPAALALARRAGARAVVEADGVRGINEAVGQGVKVARRAGAQAVLAVMGDLPAARADELERLAGALPRRGVALVASRDGTGTNALLLRPPEVIAPAFGPGSLARHRDAARRRELVVAEVEAPSLALDIDTPDDLGAYLALGRPSRTRRVLAGACLV